MSAGRNLLGMIVTGAALGLCVIAMIAMPPLDDAADQLARAKAEAKMKARLFTKYPDPMVEADRLMFPVAYPKDEK